MFLLIFSLQEQRLYEWKVISERGVSMCFFWKLVASRQPMCFSQALISPFEGLTEWNLHPNSAHNHTPLTGDKQWVPSHYQLSTPSHTVNKNKTVRF